MLLRYLRRFIVSLTTQNYEYSHCSLKRKKVDCIKQQSKSLHLLYWVRTGFFNEKWVSAAVIIFPAASYTFDKQQFLLSKQGLKVLPMENSRKAPQNTGYKGWMMPAYWELCIAWLGTRVGSMVLALGRASRGVFLGFSNKAEKPQQNTIKTFTQTSQQGSIFHLSFG